MEEHQRKLLEEVFGYSSSSSSSSDTEQQHEPSSHNNTSFSTDIKEDEKDSTLSPLPQPTPSKDSTFTWEHINPIKGLWLCRQFLSPELQASLLSAIHNEGWFVEASQNQAMRFGDLPYWAVELADHIHAAVCLGDKESGIEVISHDDESCILPSRLLWRDPFFDQLIVNLYQPGEGICAHVDLMRFEDGIAIVSLESSCVMHFSPVEKDGEELAHVSKIPVYLTPGSLVIMWGDARYQWRHEINRKPGFQVWQGQEIEQTRRTSITLRKLCSSD